MLGTTTSQIEMGIEILVGVLVPVTVVIGSALFIWLWVRLSERSLRDAMDALESEFLSARPELRKGDRDHAEAMVRYLEDRIIEIDIAHQTFRPYDRKPIELEAAATLLRRWRDIVQLHHPSIFRRAH